MKPYFTKILPIDGKIVAGDWVIDINTGFKAPLAAHAHEYAKKLNEQTYNKRAALFLCTRDIRPGDRISDKEGIIREVHHFETVLPYGVFVFEPWPSDDEKWIHAMDAYKTIGQISEEARWVKEGDEFDGSEVCWCNIGEFYQSPFSELADPLNDLALKLGREGTWKIGILNSSCKHFH